jgi:Right handed beta helix region
MKAKAHVPFFGVLCFSAMLSMTEAQAALVNVKCDSGDTIQGALNRLIAAGPNRVNVSGTCKENVKINGLDRLLLIADPTATIVDPSGGINDIIDINGSRDVTVQGFVIKGGSTGIFCAAQSSCSTTNNKIQGAGFAGIAVYQASTLISLGDSIANNNIGVLVQFGAYFETETSTIQNNSSFGVEALMNSTLRIISAKITGNVSDGVHVEQSSSARIGLTVGTPPNAIQNNGGSGVFVGDLSFVRFTSENKISGNSTQPDVSCGPQFSATRGALVNIGGGSTNCVEP